MEKAVAMLTEEEKSAVLQKGADPFERWVMQCCKADEWELRKFLKKVLARAGFTTILEDNYRSERCGSEKRYETVHNLLLIRGENPRVCLVSHTDVCRNHGTPKWEGEDTDEYAYWMRGSSASKTEDKDAPKRIPLKVRPIIKEIEEGGAKRRIITDDGNRIQVGGDDRLGVAINTYIALNTTYPMGLYFPTDEEIGLKSAGMCEMQQLKDFDLLVQTDRGNHSNELVVKIGGEILMTYSTTVRLLEIAYDIGLPRVPITGMGTDIYAIKKRNMCKEACNLTVGYHNSRGDSSDEYIDVKEAKDTLRFVSEIIKDYYLND